MNIHHGRKFTTNREEPAWHILHHRRALPRPGPDYFTQHSPAKALAISRLESLGYTVSILPLAEAV